MVCFLSVCYKTSVPYYGKNCKNFTINDTQRPDISGPCKCGIKNVGSR